MTPNDSPADHNKKATGGQEAQARRARAVLDRLKAKEERKGALAARREAWLARRRELARVIFTSWPEIPFSAPPAAIARGVAEHLGRIKEEISRLEAPYAPPQPQGAGALGPYRGPPELELVEVILSSPPAEAEAYITERLEQGCAPDLLHGQLVSDLWSVALLKLSELNLYPVPERPVSGVVPLSASPDPLPAHVELEMVCYEVTADAAKRGGPQREGPGQPPDQPTPAATGEPIALAPGGFRLGGGVFDLSGKPFFMLSALLEARDHRLSASDLRRELRWDDAQLTWPEQAVKDTAGKLRKALRDALRATGESSPGDPLPSTGEGAGLTYHLCLPTWAMPGRK
jgi:hypothetical protein